MIDVEWFDDESVLCVIGSSNSKKTNRSRLYQLNLATKELELVLTDNYIKGWTDHPFEVADVFISSIGIDITLLEWIDYDYQDYFYTVHHIFTEDTNIKQNELN